MASKSPPEQYQSCDHQDRQCDVNTHVGFLGQDFAAASGLKNLVVFSGCYTARADVGAKTSICSVNGTTCWSHRLGSARVDALLRSARPRARPRQSTSSYD